MTDDMDLVRNYVATQSPQAFATLGAPCLFVGPAPDEQFHLAKEITPAVFVILVQKSSSPGCDHSPALA